MKLNLDDNGYVVGWTLDKSDKKLSSDEVHEKIIALITEYKTKKIAEINESKEKAISEMNAIKDRAISEMNGIKEKRDIFNKIYKKDKIEEIINVLYDNRMIDKLSLAIYFFVYRYYEYLLFTSHYYKVNCVMSSSDFIKAIYKLINKIKIKSTFQGMLIIQKLYSFNNDLLDLNYNTITLYSATYNEKLSCYVKENLLIRNTIDAINEYINSACNRNTIFLIEVDSNEKPNEPSIVVQYLFYPIEDYNDAIVRKEKEEEGNAVNTQIEDILKPIKEKYCNNINTKDSFKTIWNKISFNQNNYNIFVDNGNLLIDLLSSFNPNTAPREIVFHNLIFSTNNNLSNVNIPNKTINNTVSLEQLPNITQSLLNHFYSEVKAFELILELYQTIIRDELINQNQGTSQAPNLSINEIDTQIDNFYFVDFIENTLREQEEFNINITNTANDEFSTIRRFIDDQFVIFEGDLQTIVDKYVKLIDDIKALGVQYINKLRQLNQIHKESIISLLKQVGIYSEKIDSYLTQIDEESLIHDTINFSFTDSELLDILSRVGISTGIGALLGGVTTFGLQRLFQVVATDAIAGGIAGPIGIGVGVVVGIGTLIGQFAFSFSKKRKKANNLYDDMKNCVLMVIDLIRTRTNDYTTTNINNMREVMIKEKQFIHILLSFSRENN